MAPRNRATIPKGGLQPVATAKKTGTVGGVVRFFGTGCELCERCPNPFRPHLHLHLNGVTHMDIDSDHFFLNADLRVSLLDFLSATFHYPHHFYHEVCHCFTSRSSEMNDTIDVVSFDDHSTSNRIRWRSDLSHWATAMYGWIMGRDPWGEKRGGSGLRFSCSGS
jgi:hypothetical protein